MHRLVVVAVDAHLDCTEHVGKRCLRQDLHEVLHAVVRGTHAVADLAGVLAVEVLVEGAAQVGVDQLKAAAYAQHGHVGVERDVEEGAVELVAQAVAVPAAGLHALPVHLGRDILPAGEEQAAAHARDLLDFSRRALVGDHEGDGTAGRDHVAVVGEHPYALALVVVQRGYCDEGLVHMRAFRKGGLPRS